MPAPNENGSPPHVQPIHESRLPPPTSMALLATQALAAKSAVKMSVTAATQQGSTTTPNLLPVPTPQDPRPLLMPAGVATSVTGNRSFACEHPTCRKSFMQVGHLERHLSIHSQEFQCADCQKRFSRESHLVRHLRIHSGDFKCPWCHRRFAGAQTLERHQGKHPEANVTHPYLCTICEQRFGMSSQLKAHKNAAHSGDRPYSCPVCPKTFKSLSVLQGHERTHTGERPYACKWKTASGMSCTRSFAMMHNLLTHQRIHDNIKYHVCGTPGCGKAFSRKNNLEVHMRLHTGEKPFVCGMDCDDSGAKCTKSFAVKGNLINHQAVHTGVRFECDVCSKRFLRKGNLTTHKKNHGKVADGKGIDGKGIDGKGVDDKSIDGKRIVIVSKAQKMAVAEAIFNEMDDEEILKLLQSKVLAKQRRALMHGDAAAALPTNAGVSSPTATVSATAPASAL